MSHCAVKESYLFVFNSYLIPLTPMSDQDRIYPDNIKQTSDENKEKYQLGDYQLIQYQMLRTNITRLICQTVRRITNEIVEAEGLKGLPPVTSI